MELRLWLPLAAGKGERGATVEWGRGFLLELDRGGGRTTLSMY